jgi:hypothetical protein
VEGRGCFLHTALKRGREGNIFIRNWFVIDVEVADKGMIKFTKAMQLRNIGECLYKAGCK